MQLSTKNMHTPPRRIIGIKAGSSVFQDEYAYAAVADLLVPLLDQADQIYFVVSAVKGATDRTIEQLAREEVDQRGGVYDSVLPELQNPLKGNPPNYRGRFNRPDIAARLVEPEMESTRHIGAALRQRGVSVDCMVHGAAYPLVGVNNGSYLYATPDIETSRNNSPKYNTQFVVVPGFGVRNQRGEIMCTGRGSSDLTLVQIAEVYGIPEIVYWKDTGGFWRSPHGPEAGVYDTMTREEATQRGGEKVLDRRIYDFNGGIRITSPGSITGGTYIQPPLPAVLEAA